jgi:molybdopterin synthase sulfur carrier subunit
MLDSAGGLGFILRATRGGWRQRRQFGIELLSIHQPSAVGTMARFMFTQQLARFTTLPQVETAAGRLRAGLDAAFAANPRLRGYVLDEQGHLRENVVIFIDGRRCTDRVALDDPLRPDSMVYVLQALSGG